MENKRMEKRINNWIARIEWIAVEVKLRFWGKKLELELYAGSMVIISG